MTPQPSPLTWRYEIDPAFAPDGEVPPHAVKRAVRIDANGRSVGDWMENPSYAPSVLARLLEADPSDAFLSDFGAHLRGELEPGEFRHRFAARSFACISSPQRDAILLVDSNGAPAYSLYSSPRFVPGAAPVIPFTGDEILALRGACSGLLINAGEHGALWLPIEDLL